MRLHRARGNGVCGSGAVRTDISAEAAASIPSLADYPRAAIAAALKPQPEQKFAAENPGFGPNIKGLFTATMKSRAVD